MNRSEPETAEQRDRAHVEPADVLRYVRQAGYGLMMASLLVSWASHHRDQLRRRMAYMQYRVLYNDSNPGAGLAELAVEILDATSPKRPRG